MTGILDQFGIIPIFLVLGILYLISKYKSLLWITIIKLPRDIKLASRAAQFFIALKIGGWENFTAGKALEKSVKKCPNKICFYFGDEEWTFQQVEDLSNKFANYFASKNYKKGDVVALFMDNRPEYVCIWLGLSKIGVVTALVNYNLRLQSLEHCVKVANAKAIIFSNEFGEAIQDVMNEGGFKQIHLYSFDSVLGSKPSISSAYDMKIELKNVSSAGPTLNYKINHNDQLCYIYTSGTTGLPKAAILKHSRLLLGCSIFHHLNGSRSDDIFLTPLPLYHIAGGMMVVGQALVHTTSVVIVKKFSASRFWHDCIRYNVTVTQYMGELCRFLLAQPKKPEETSHQLRLVMGNGLRADIWDEFQKRFKIPELVETYGSTEGNCGLSNLDNKVGAVGYLPRILMPLLPMALVKVDEKTGEPIRDPKTGLAIVCQPNEPGELMGVIGTGNASREFSGYTDSKASEKKVVRNIFKKNDSCFRAGDILIMDEYGYFYFRDRTGDTFRWKSENVSTTEVESVMNRLTDMRDVAVYGVKVPGTDGRAGMAAISDPQGTLDLESLAQGLQRSLPAYARPIFIRILTENVDLTGTFKLKKVDLQKEEFDLTLIKDKLYIFQNGKYVPLTEELHTKVVSGQLRL